MDRSDLERSLDGFLPAANIWDIIEKDCDGQLHQSQYSLESDDHRHCIMFNSKKLHSRRHHERNHDTDGIQSYQKDGNRLLYCFGLQRLAGVTQVISPLDSAAVQNRLTHTLKVAQVARRLAEKTAAEADTPGDIKIPNGDFTESAALAHDLGHPAFGRIGENELDRCLTAAGDMQGFEGNAQSFRYVTKLATWAPEYRGLNLTRGSLAGLLKHPNIIGSTCSHKRGIYSYEADDLAWATQLLAADSRSTEADIVDWADDITYAIHDVQDFYLGGTIPIDMLSKKGIQRARFLDEVCDTSPHEHPDFLQNRECCEDAFVQIIAKFAPDKGSNGSSKQAIARAAGTKLIARFIDATRLSIDETNGSSLRIKSYARNEVELMKLLTRYYVLKSERVRLQNQRYSTVVKELFEALIDNTNGNLIPRSFLIEIDKGSPRLRLAADTIACLTDRQALHLHQLLTGKSSIR